MRADHKGRMGGSGLPEARRGRIEEDLRALKAALRRRHRGEEDTNV